MIKKEYFKPVLLAFILIISTLSSLLSITGFLILSFFAVLVYSYSGFEKNEKYSHFLYHTLGFAILIVAIILYQHLLPGFNNILIFDKIQVSKEAVPFTMYFNIDKTLTALILFLLVVPIGVNLKQALKKTCYLIVISIFLLMGLALLFNFVKIDFKFHKYFFIWILNNLLVVTMAEEILFRGFFQKHLLHLKIKYPEFVAIVVASLAFGALHWKGGIYYVIYATIAGVMYGLIYQKSKNIILTILSHFLLNLIHIIFFTYPFLK